MHITSVRTPGLGDTTYVLVHDGRAIIVDPQRDIDRFLDVVGKAETRWVLETHLHNDYVSGAREVARTTGADLVLPAGAAPAYRHTPAFHQEDLRDGDLAVRPIHTPGHTPEHTSYLVLIDGVEVALFSGGSLLVGSAGRSDLLGPERADTLSRLQYRSVNRLAALPDPVGLFPTHGEGSFCTSSGAGRLTSTIGDERRTNPVLAHRDEDSFVTSELQGLQPFPSYYRHMGPINLRGPAPMPDRPIPRLTGDAMSRLADDTVVVDARARHRQAAGRQRGSVGVELREEFGTWVGWLVDHDAPLVLVLDGESDLPEATVQLARIGMDTIRGHLAGGDVPEGSGYAMADVARFAEASRDGEQVLDVRAPDEWEAGHLDGSIHRYVPDLVRSTDGLDPASPVWVACASGFRSAIAAAHLTDAGFDVVALLDGGVDDVHRALAR